MTNVQNFTYHSHNNSQGIFDGSNSAEEMITRAEELGFEAIGVSNHLCLHPNMPVAHRMFFNDPQKALDVYKRMYAELDEAATRHKIKIYKGLEVDFFPSAVWRNWFEKLIKQLDYDYLIGASHFARNADETFMCNIFHLKELPPETTRQELDELLRGYWSNVLGAAESGYFDFIAHFDYCTQFNLCMTPEWDDIKWRIIDALTTRKQPFEINTGGISRIGRPFPNWNMAEELIKREVPVVISCDSHKVEDIGRHFAEVEDFLKKAGCKQRFKLSK